MGILCALVAVGLLFFAELHTVQCVQVTCTHREEVCECPSNAMECEFTLEIQNLTTFTSYALIDEYLSKRTSLTYSIDDRRGFLPARNCRGFPVNTQLLHDSDFLNAGCSVPMTVDGNFEETRNFTGVNGRIPGPTIIVWKNQIVKVTVVNLIECRNDGTDDDELNPTSISLHWHGMHQVNTFWMDGVGKITQVPIACKRSNSDGSSFDYIFRATPAGTHWYHSHSGIQRTEGLFGSLIVREPPSSSTSEARIPTLTNGLTMDDTPDMHTLTLLDWYQDGRKPSELNEAIYRSGLINGRGRLNNGNAIAPLSVFPVSRNMNYRFRIVGAQNHFPYEFFIEGHRFHLIATDGNGIDDTFISPTLLSSLVVHSGERYDIIVNTSSTPSQNNYYMIIAQKIDIENDEQTSNATNPAVALLYYGSSTNLDWTQITQLNSNSVTRPSGDAFNCLTNAINGDYRCISWDELTTQHFSRSESLPNVRTLMNDLPSIPVFNFAFEGPDGDASISGTSFNFEDLMNPYFCNEGASNSNNCNDPPQKCISIYPISSSNQVMVFTAFAGESKTPHPVHLHGHGFYVVDVGYDNTSFNCSTTMPISDSDEVINCTLNSSSVFNGKVDGTGRINNNLIQKDTVLVPGGGYVVIAFQANNPGYWFLHCHIEKHLSQGMALIVESRPYEQHTCPPESITQKVFSWSIQDYRSYTDPPGKCTQDNDDCAFIESTSPRTPGGGSMQPSPPNGAMAGTSKAIPIVVIVLQLVYTMVVTLI